MCRIIVFTIFITISVSLSKSSHHVGGFDVDLIHRDSTLSPLYNPTHSLIDRNQNAFLRSMSRHSESPAKVDVDISAEYIMKIGIGSPPVQVFVTVSISIDLAWTPCEPCKTCYKQPGVPFFVPASSSTYHTNSCQSKACNSQNIDKPPPCDTQNNICHYENNADTFYITNGVLARDTFWIGSTPFKQVIFGCAHEIKEIPFKQVSIGGAHEIQYFSTNVSGFIGLGGGPLSLVNQLKSAIQGKFSYCLMPRSSSLPSKIYFGELFNMSGPTAVSTSLVKIDYSNFYIVHLFDVLVGNKSVSSYNHNQSNNEKTNMIIDIDSPLTYLPSVMYGPVSAGITKAIGGNPFAFDSYNICYKDLSWDRVPVLTLRFTGADVEVLPTYMFMEVQKGVSCLTIIQGSPYVGVLGTLFQTNLMVGFDLIKQKVYFKPTDCAIR